MIPISRGSEGVQQRHAAAARFTRVIHHTLHEVVSCLEQGVQAVASQHCFLCLQQVQEVIVVAVKASQV